MIVVGGLPVYHYCAADSVAEAYAMVLLVDSGFAQQTEVARAFGKSERTVRRYQERYAQAGMVGLGREEGWRRGRRRISGKRLRSIERLKSQGLSNRAIAQRLGVNEKAIRKLVGPSKPAESRAACVATMTARSGERAAGDCSMPLQVDGLCGSRHTIGEGSAQATGDRSAAQRKTPSRCR